MSLSPRPTSEKVRAHRASKRAAGLRLVQFWAPDVRSKSFLKQAREQSLRAAQSEAAADDQRFIDAISDRE